MDRLIEEFRPKKMEVHRYPCYYDSAEIQYMDQLIRPERTRFYHEPVKHQVNVVDIGKETGDYDWYPKDKPYHISLRSPAAVTREHIYMSREDMVMLISKMDWLLGQEE